MHQRLRKQGADLTGLNELASMPGGWAALWSTIKDLKDARVDAGTVLEAFSQSPLSTDRRLQSVIRLYQAWCDDQNRHSLYDHDDVAVLALDLVSASSWLRQQAHIFYYGFYDLTQGQLDLFQMIVRQYPATLYFPLLNQHPAFRFAQQFFDQYVHGLATGPIEHKIETASPFRDLFDPSLASRSRKPDVPHEPTADGTDASVAGTWRNENRSAGANGAQGFCRLATVSARTTKSKWWPRRSWPWCMSSGFLFMTSEWWGGRWPDMKTCCLASFQSMVFPFRRPCAGP